jgi:two-component system response regulator MtrA
VSSMQKHLFTGKRILVVDDETAVVHTLNLIFRSRGFEVRAAKSAEEALEKVAGWRPDIAVLDVVLPGMNGLDFAVLLAQQARAPLGAAPQFRAPGTGGARRPSF